MITPDHLEGMEKGFNYLTIMRNALVMLTRIGDEVMKDFTKRQNANGQCQE